MQGKTRYTRNGLFATLFIMALVFAAAALWQLFLLPDPALYRDEGVYTFVPYQVLPIQVKNNATGRSRRMNPTKTVYKVYYRTEEYSGYEWSQKAPSKTAGADIVAEKKPCRRRVLSRADTGTYLTVDADQTAKTHFQSLRRRCLLITGGCLLYCAVSLILYILAARIRKNRRGTSGYFSSRPTGQ